jgi:phasin family protein
MAKASNGAAETEFKVPNFSQLYADYTRMLGDFGKVFGSAKTPFLDVDTVMTSQRKTIEALTKANKVAFEGAQAAAQRQVDLIRRSLDDLARMGRELTASGSPEDKLARQADIAKESLAAAVGGLREVTELLQKSNFAAVDVISQRVSDNFDEVKTALRRLNGSH